MIFQERSIMFKLVLLSMLLIVSPVFAKSQELPYKIEYVPETPLGPLLSFKGTFVKGLTENFIRALILHPDVKAVTMSSPGGSLDEGYKLGSAMSDYNLIVMVPKGQVCVSACALAFVGGWKYLVGGLLAFHSPYLPKYEPQTVLEDIYYSGQYTGVQQMYYFAANGFRAQLYMTIAQYTDRENYMVITNTNDLHHYLMIEKRTYKDYLSFTKQPDTVIQAGPEEFAKLVKAKQNELFDDLTGDPADQHQKKPEDLLGPRKDKLPGGSAIPK